MASKKGAMKQIDDVLALLSGSAEGNAKRKGRSVAEFDRASDLLTRMEKAADHEIEPIRTIHHLSCTGGTLIAKCVASMPNVLLLNEVDPLSPLPFRKGRPPFTPTNVVALLKQGDPDIQDDLIVRLFATQMAFLRDEQSKIGRVLVLRDHSHSHFLTGPKVPDRPTLRQIVPEPVRSIVTIRDPIDSYLSMETHGWHTHFSPSSFEEYCRRYLLFLELYEQLPVFSYEEFVADTNGTMKDICSALDLRYSESFENLFHAFKFSGDSGRTSGKIEQRPPREGRMALEKAAQTSRTYLKLTELMKQLLAATVRSEPLSDTSRPGRFSSTGRG